MKKYFEVLTLYNMKLLLLGFLSCSLIQNSCQTRKSVVQRIVQHSYCRANIVTFFLPVSSSVLEMHRQRREGDSSTTESPGKVQRHLREREAEPALRLQHEGHPQRAQAACQGQLQHSLTIAHLCMYVQYTHKRARAHTHTHMYTRVHTLPCPFPFQPSPFPITRVHI